MANASPWAMKGAQSSAVWFQRAASERRSPASRSAATSRAIASASEGAIADLELGGLPEARPAALHPVGDPVEHAAEGNQRRAEQRRRARRVREQRRRRLLADDLGGHVEPGGELVREPAD